MAKFKQRTAAAGLLLFIFTSVAPIAFGDPLDPFSTALPGRDTQPPEGVAGSGGGVGSASSVSEQQGAAMFSFPIEVPPGRNGMTPRLSLDYSSSGELRGGVAVGWSLSLPSVERDPAAPGATYRLSMGGPSKLLIEEPGDYGGGTGTRYRAELDEGFARVLFRSKEWTVSTPDGVVRTFARDLNASDASTIWNLTKEVDPFGNEVVYSWGSVTTGGYQAFHLLSIDYTSNPGAGLGPHARVELTNVATPQCSGATFPIGAQTDNHFGKKRMRSPRRLNEIKTWVRDVQGGPLHVVRKIALGYDAAEATCNINRPSLRFLTDITATAYDAVGTPTVAPPVRFSYGPKLRIFGPPTTSSVNGIGEYGTRKGPESGLMDIDGDGVVDQVRVTMPDTGHVRCQLLWRKGGFGGTFAATETATELPSARWDGPGGRPSQFDSCTLNGQFAWRASSITQDPNNQLTCGTSAIQESYHFIDWDHDGDLDLVTGQRTSGIDLGACGDFSCPIAATSANSDDGGDNHGCPGGSIYTEGQIEDQWTECQCPGDQAWDPQFQMCHTPCGEDEAWNGVLCVQSCGAYETCRGLPPDPPGGGGGAPPPAACTPTNPDPEHTTSGFQWRVFWNTAGTFDPAPASLTGRTEFSAALPVPVGGGEMAPDIAGPPTLPSLVDLDGDGWLDLIKLNTLSLGSSTGIHVWRGGAVGWGFEEASVAWTKPTWYQEPRRIELIGGAFNLETETSTARLIDLNGDGLDDLVVNTNGNPAGLQVSYNMGGSFAALKPLNRATPAERSRLEQPAGWRAPMPLMQGWRGQEVQLMDLDADGLPEQAEVFTGSSVSVAASGRRVARFDGEVFLGLYDPGTQYEAIERLVTANTQLANTYATWYRASDFTDVTGDGLPDLVTFSSTGQPTVRTDLAGDPLRLLTTVDNGRGGTTRFSYAMSTDPSVVTLAGATNTPRWVVSRMTITPGFLQPDITTRFRYEQPQHGRSSDADSRPPQFLGFAKVTKDTSGQLGAQSSRTVDRYGYMIGHDHRGHVIESWRYAGTGGGNFQPATTTRTDWTYATLLDGKVGFSYPAVTTTRTCAAGATELQCAAEAQAVSTTRQTYTPWSGPSGSLRLFYENVATSVEWPRADGQLQKLVTVRKYNERIGQSPYAITDYRILLTLEEQSAVSAQGAVTTMGRTTITRDVAGLPTQTAVGMSAASTARTTRTFDAVTGNVLTVRRPNQTAINGNKVTTYAYDPHKLFALQTTNELGHKVFDRHDYGTGVLVYREGPNSRNPQVDPKCTARIGAPPCPTIAAYEPEQWIIDGFGRVIEHRVAVDPASGPGAGYALAAVQWTSYVDNVSPNRRKQESLRDFGGSVRLIAEDTFDGMGRVTRHAEKQASPLPDAATMYTYDAAGAIAAIGSPDPRIDTGAVVGTTYQRDGLGRVISLTRPDGSEQLVSYSGLDVTSRDRSPVEGYGAATTASKDALGRLERVTEFDDAMGAVPHSTYYTYDVLGRMTTIVDADGNQTGLAHDWAGHRTSVIRGSRVWSYQYDANGNMVRQMTPKPFGASDADYTSLTTYDDLDRSLTHIPATRGMSTQRRDQLYIGASWNEYDTGPDAIGRQTRVVFVGGTVDTLYGVRGLASREKLTVNFSQGAALSTSQAVDRTYNALGAQTSETWDDGSTWRTSYDERGQLLDVQWKDPSSGVYRAVATYGRSLNGAPRTRVSYYDQARSWSYDVLGRVVYDRVYRPTTGASWAERTYGFDGFGRLGAVSGQVNAQLADAVFEHDGRGRITRAQGPYTYGAQFEYSPAGNVTRATVGGASDVADRNVRYSYGAVDPQAVDQLADVQTGQIVAQLGYDPSGNVTTRSVLGEDHALTWDGDDQTREVTGPDGAEVYVFAGAARRVAAIGPDGIKLWFGASETHHTTSGEALRWLHITAGEVIARIQNKTVLELQYADALQNLVLTLSPTGAVMSSFLYGAFGEVVASSGEATHRRGFNGKEHDEISGLRFYGYRSYDPLLMRWASADPLYRFAPDKAWAEPQRANLYAFSLNNPLRYYDPDGRDGKIEAPQLEIGDIEPLETLLPGETRDAHYSFLDWEWTGSSTRGFKVRATLVTFSSDDGDTVCRIGSADASVDAEGNFQFNLIGMDASHRVFKRDYAEARVGFEVGKVGFDSKRGMQFVIVRAYGSLSAKTRWGDVTAKASFGPQFTEDSVGMYGLEVSGRPDERQIAHDIIVAANPLTLALSWMF